ncbi:hypothetical protein [Dyadobacter luticola]|uniref:Uncharacterized protein n=1 Tax=Dyadobacter luticola TaxID=1979387 RepID=A0A5R9L196_9BACT|nr:hypothetical protein [Dyadobacter luticola]TLV02326.1 hypothetical protein FEN17_01410 [Dyadobacter luticola]
MKRIALIGILSLITACTFSWAQTDKGVYKALSSSDEQTIEKALAELEGEKVSSKTNAYKGVLTMKKAGFVNGVGGKLKTFKKGVRLLEDEITANPANVEYRFLRLTIQEHAPGILNYNKQLDEDKEAVVAGYGKMNPGLKNYIADYAKDSKVLKEADLK